MIRFVFFGVFNFLKLFVHTDNCIIRVMVLVSDTLIVFRSGFNFKMIFSKHHIVTKSLK